MEKHARLLSREEFPLFLDAIRHAGYEIVGPTIRDQAIVYDHIAKVEDLPVGWGDQQDAGHYRLTKRGDAALFGYNAGPHSWKKFLFPPAVTLWGAEKTEDGFRVKTPEPDQAHYAFLGVRACELAAIKIQDKILIDGPFVDENYVLKRERALFIAVQCGQAAATCFCGSMDTGPHADEGFDLALTEIISGRNHFFLVEIGTNKGQQIVDTLALEKANKVHLEAALAISERTRGQMGRHMTTDGIKGLLYENLEHPLWESVAERCLSCANCTMVCPTCFCTSVEDVTDLAGKETQRVRHWDSCFNTEYSHMTGGSTRQSTKSRYRQWISHKLASWHDQFGSSGCVGCGRCIAWCPVGIDITAEVAALQNSEKK